MNLKLLEKLVRLANNNPNENESNLAARKVCRIIEEGKFKFVQDPFQPSKAQEDFINKKPPTTWNDVKRSTEPEFKSSRDPFSWATDSFDFDFADIFNKYKQSQQPKDPRWREKTASEQARDSQTYRYKVEYGRKSGKNSRGEKRPLNCKKCGKEYLTGFVGPPQMFTCNTCYWVIYHEEQETKKGNNQ